MNVPSPPPSPQNRTIWWKEVLNLRSQEWDKKPTVSGCWVKLKREKSKAKDGCDRCEESEFENYSSHLTRSVTQIFNSDRWEAVVAVVVKTEKMIMSSNGGPDHFRYLWTPVNDERAVMVLGLSWVQLYIKLEINCISPNAFEKASWFQTFTVHTSIPLQNNHHTPNRAQINRKNKQKNRPEVKEFTHSWNFETRTRFSHIFFLGDQRYGWRLSRNLDYSIYRMHTIGTDFSSRRGDGQFRPTSPLDDGLILRNTHSLITSHPFASRDRRSKNLIPSHLPWLQNSLLNPTHSLITGRGWAMDRRVLWTWVGSEHVTLPTRSREESRTGWKSPDAILDAYWKVMKIYISYDTYLPNPLDSSLCLIRPRSGWW